MIELERFAVVRDGAVVVALERVGAAAVIVRAGVSRIEPDRLVEVGKGGVELTLLVVLVPADAVGGGEPAACFELGIDDLGAGCEPLRAGVSRRDARLPGWRVFGLRQRRRRE